MKTRIIVAAVGLPLLLLVLLVLPPVATGILVGAMSVIAVYELLYMTGLARNLYLLVLSALMALAVAMWSCRRRDVEASAGGHLALPHGALGGDALGAYGAEV